MTSLLFIFLQSVFNRWRGSGSSFPQTSRRMSCLFVPVMCLCLAGVENWLIYLSIPLMYLGVCAPHGRYFTLGRGPYPDRPDDWPSFLSRFVGFKRIGWKFDALSLSVTGIVFVLPFSIAVFTVNPLSSFLSLVSGVCKTLGYEIALRITKGDHIRNAEIITGIIYGIGFTSAIWTLKLL